MSAALKSAPEVETTTPEPGATEDVSPRKLSMLAETLAEYVGSAATQITRITGTSRLLSFNARIEAARAGGAAGDAFSVVATAMTELANQTSVVARDMQTRVHGIMSDLTRIASHLGSEVRGTRLSDLALANIDLIDRNLYERSCDCRWWATDTAFVNALQEPVGPNISQACRRMATILNAYTVYYDLVLTDARGRIVATGRPERFQSTGRDCSSAPWFTSAMTTTSGEDFAFQSVNASPLANGQRVLVYSAAVRSGGELHGQPIGCLGVVFNWDGLAKKIIEQTPLSGLEKKHTRVLFADSNDQVLSDSLGMELRETLAHSVIEHVKHRKKGFGLADINGLPHIVAHAAAPGFETYTTGWHSYMIQPVDL